jgi:hypothetical protein
MACSGPYHCAFSSCTDSRFTVMGLKASDAVGPGPSGEHHRTDEEGHPRRTVGQLFGAQPPLQADGEGGAVPDAADGQVVDKAAAPAVLGAQDVVLRRALMEVNGVRVASAFGTVPGVLSCVVAGPPAFPADLTGTMEA